MFVLTSAVVVAACLQVIASDHPEVPPECRGPPAGVSRPLDCCKIPMLFEGKEFEECGFEMNANGDGPKMDGHGPPPHDCTKQQCLLENKNLLKDGEIDKAAFSAMLDQWADTNADFKPTVETAKERCLENELPGPPHLCNEIKLMFCIAHTLFSECPIWEDTDECKLVKDHMKKCTPHFKQN